MSYVWQYPIYLISHGVGFASLVDPNAVVQPTHLLVVYSDRQAAEDLMTQFEIHGSVRPLHNDREFRWILQGIRAPVTDVAFDPRPTTEDVNPGWRVSVAELLCDHLAVASLAISLAIALIYASVVRRWPKRLLLPADPTTETAETVGRRLAGRGQTYRIQFLRRRVTEEWRTYWPQKLNFEGLTQVFGFFFSSFAGSVGILRSARVSETADRRSPESVC